MIRSFLVVLFIVLVGILSLPLYLVVFIIGKFDERKKAAVTQKIVGVALRAIMLISGVKLDVQGIENVPKDEAVLYIANHRGYFDTVVTYPMVPTLTRYIAKADMQKLPVVSRWMKILKCLFIERDNPKQSLGVIITSIQYIKEGYSIFVMPEGTRNHKDELLPFKDGTFKIASKTGCKVIPVAIKGTDDILENHSPKIKAGKVSVRYGKPVDMAEFTADEKKRPGEKFRQIVTDMLKEM